MHLWWASSQAWQARPRVPEERLVVGLVAQRLLGRVAVPPSYDGGKEDMPPLCRVAKMRSGGNEKLPQPLITPQSGCIQAGLGEGIELVVSHGVVQDKLECWCAVKPRRHRPFSPFLAFLRANFGRGCACGKPISTRIPLLEDFGTWRLHGTDELMDARARLFLSLIFERERDSPSQPF